MDTAAAYMNEEALGKAVKRAIADGLTTREELFITTKVWVQDQKNEDTAYEAVKTSLAKLDMEYVELVLLHQAQEDAIALMKEYGIVPQAWGPLAEGKHGIFTDPEMTAIGEKYGKTAAQVALRWNVQRGVSINAKSTHVERMEQNLAIWDFELTEEEMVQITAKSLDHSEIINHFDPQLVKMLNGMAIHE